LIVTDTSFVLALLDARDTYHGDATRWHARDDEDWATTPLVLAELDYLSDSHGGRRARTAFRSNVAAGVFLVEWWETASLEAVEIAERYGDLGVSLTDASLVALADRLETTRIATFDERHFRAMTPLRKEAAFTLLPLDV
jgi:predicted nucleic acid-binding protein